jgi:hypothetical protein
LLRSRQRECLRGEERLEVSLRRRKRVEDRWIGREGEPSNEVRHDVGSIDEIRSGASERVLEKNGERRRIVGRERGRRVADGVGWRGERGFAHSGEEGREGLKVGLAEEKVVKTLDIGREGGWVRIG